MAYLVLLQRPVHCGTYGHVGDQGEQHEGRSVLADVLVRCGCLVLEKPVIRSKKQPKCKNPACRQPFTPMNSMQNVCHYNCGLALAKITRDRKEAQLARMDRRQTKERRENLKTYGDHVADAEKAVRDFRRLEELSLGSGCMSCGKSQEEVRAAQGWKTGGAFDAGHWMGKGARPELRLEPMNIWLQCKGCNGGSAKYARKGESVKEGFEAGVIERIGKEAAEALKNDHRPRHYTIDQLKAITKEYRAKVRELKNLVQ